MDKKREKWLKDYETYNTNIASLKQTIIKRKKELWGLKKDLKGLKKDRLKLERRLFKR